MIASRRSRPASVSVLVLGCGSIGFRHIGHLRELGVTHIAAADQDPAAGRRAAARYGITVTSDAAAALERQPKAVLVCTPASTHVSLVRRALEAGADVFVEKPLATTLDGVDGLRRLARRRRRIVQVGYNLRFHPAFVAMRRIVGSGRLGPVLMAHAEFGLDLRRWWPGRDYRDSYMADPASGGDLVLDVSHEIDLLSWFFGPVREVSGMAAKNSRLQMKSPDIIKVLMRMESGVIVSFHIDCIQPTYTRRFFLTGHGTALHWDCPVGRADRALGRLMICGRRDARFRPLALGGNPRDTYLLELRSFLDSVRTRRPPMADLDEGAEVLRVVDAIQRALRTGRTVRV